MWKLHNYFYAINETCYMNVIYNHSKENWDVQYLAGQPCALLTHIMVEGDRY